MEKKELPGKLFHTDWMWMNSGWIFSAFMASCLKSGYLCWIPTEESGLCGILQLLDTSPLTCSCVW